MNTAILSLDTFTQRAHQYDTVTLAVKILSDYDTPSSIFKKLRAHYLLESVDKGESVGRYSIIGLGEHVRITFTGTRIRLLEEHIEKGRPPHCDVIDVYDNPLLFIREYFLSLTSPNEANLVGKENLPFWGGLLGYLGYETVRYFEAIPVGKDVLGLPEGIIVFPKLVAVHDTVSRELTLTTTILIRRRKYQVKWERTPLAANFMRLPSSLWQEKYHEAATLLKAAVRTIEKPSAISLYTLPTSTSYSENSENSGNKQNNNAPILPLQGEFCSNMSTATYKKNVEQLIDYIRDGEMIQAVLSQRYSLKAKVDDFELYRSLKMINPSPFLYYLNFQDFSLAGSSPEVMVCLTGDKMLLRPIAGSIRRGRDVLEDEVLARELLRDEKECAEHLMLVDLGRNDLSKVATRGSVEVENYMTVERYSQIQHIASTVTATKAPQHDVVDMIMATFPAGTLSGAPKVRAMELLATLETDKRGPYSGVIFNLGLGGNFNSCICIRTFLIIEDMLHAQVGSGIVLDSHPQREQRECEQKIAALMKAYTRTKNRLQQVRAY